PSRPSAIARAAAGPSRRRRSARTVGPTPRSLPRRPRSGIGAYRRWSDPPLTLRPRGLHGRRASTGRNRARSGPAFSSPGLLSRVPQYAHEEHNPVSLLTQPTEGEPCPTSASTSRRSRRAGSSSRSWFRGIPARPPDSLTRERSISDHGPWPVSLAFIGDEREGQDMNPDVVEAIARLRAGNVLSSGQAALFDRVARRRLVSLSLEIRALLYAGVLLLTSGVGLLVSEHHREIGPLAIADAIALAGAACLAWVMGKAPPFTWEESPSPNVAFDYVLLLGLLLFASDLAYVEVQFTVL